MAITWSDNTNTAPTAQADAARFALALDGEYFLEKAQEALQQTFLATIEAGLRKLTERDKTELDSALHKWRGQTPPLVMLKQSTKIVQCPYPAESNHATAVPNRRLSGIGALQDKCYFSYYLELNQTQVTVGPSTNVKIDVSDGELKITSEFKFGRLVTFKSLHSCAIRILFFRKWINELCDIIDRDTARISYTYTASDGTKKALARVMMSTLFGRHTKDTEPFYPNGNGTNLPDTCLDKQYIDGVTDKNDAFKCHYYMYPLATETDGAAGFGQSGIHIVIPKTFPAFFYLTDRKKENLPQEKIGNDAFVSVRGAGGVVKQINMNQLDFLRQSLIFVADKAASGTPPSSVDVTPSLLTRRLTSESSPYGRFALGMARSDRRDEADNCWQHVPGPAISGFPLGDCLASALGLTKSPHVPGPADAGKWAGVGQRDGQFQFVREPGSTDYVRVPLPEAGSLGSLIYAKRFHYKGSEDPQYRNNKANRPSWPPPLLSRPLASPADFKASLAEWTMLYDTASPARLKNKGELVSAGHHTSHNEDARESTKSVMGGITADKLAEDWFKSEEGKIYYTKYMKWAYSANRIDLAIDPNHYTPPRAKQEWCHLVGHGDGGKDSEVNLVAGSRHANTEQLAIETALSWNRVIHDEILAVRVTAYLPRRTFVKTLAGSDRTKYRDIHDYIDKNMPPIAISSEGETKKAIRDRLLLLTFGIRHDGIEIELEKLVKPVARAIVPIGPMEKVEEEISKYYLFNISICSEILKADSLVSIKKIAGENIKSYESGGDTIEQFSRWRAMYNLLSAISDEYRTQYFVNTQVGLFFRYVVANRSTGDKIFDHMFDGQKESFDVNEFHYTVIAVRQAVCEHVDQILDIQPPEMIFGKKKMAWDKIKNDRDECGHSSYVAQHLEMITKAARANAIGPGGIGQAIMQEEKKILGSRAERIQLINQLTSLKRSGTEPIGGEPRKEKKLS